MSRARPVTLKHLAVTVLVVVLVNAQLTWWIVFVLRENRMRLGLERGRMAAATELEAERLSHRLEQAELALAAALAGGARIEAGPPPAPFAAWSWAGQPCARLWSVGPPAELSLRLPAGAGCVNAVVDAGTAERMLAVAPGVELVKPPTAVSVGAAPPAAAVDAAPSIAVRPAAAPWSAALHGYRQRILMMVSEGTFFAILLLVLVALLWRTLRREAELERQHRNFLSAITHELKSPLASMRLALETVLSGRADEASGRRFLNNALQDAERLQDLVQKVLETTRYGHGAHALRQREASLSQLVGRAVEAVRARVESAGGRITSELEPQLCAVVDEEALTIAVSNLIENAVKYGGRHPQLRVRAAAEHGRAVIEVSDTGDGIPADEAPFVFDMFYRAGDELSRTSQGTGLGLYLVRQIVHAHRGTVRIATTGPEGTTFRVELPGAERKESGP
jgi:two-component system, OmpR family, phosphate regulon sensor histidine kinase PhoR